MSDTPMGWDRWPASFPDSWLAERTYPDGLSVLVRVTADPSGLYVVSEEAEHRCSGPVETAAGTFASLTEAVAVAVTLCREWDEWSAKK